MQILGERVIKFRKKRNVGEHEKVKHKNYKLLTKAQDTRCRIIKMILEILALLVMLVLITGAAGKMGDPSNPMDTYAIVGSCIIATVILILFVVAGGVDDD